MAMPSPGLDVGLPADQGEDGSVLRVKDVLLPLAPEARGGAGILGFACDEGVRRNHGRPGAAQGPTAIRQMLGRLPIHGRAVIHDAGDVACTDGDLEAAQERLGRRVAELLGCGIHPVVLGGGHEIAYGSFLGLVRHFGDGFPARRPLIINLDAHFDLRRAPHPNSGTPFRQIAELCAAKGVEFRYLCFGISALANTTSLFERAENLRVEYWLDEQMREHDRANLRAALGRRLAAADTVYLSIDLDVLPGSVAPGVSAPAPRGVALEIIEDLVDDVIASGKLTLADIAELNPTYDRDGQTARIAARLAYKLLKLPLRPPVIATAA